MKKPAEMQVFSFSAHESPIFTGIRQVAIRRGCA
jgi:hypothetical protein